MVKNGIVSYLMPLALAGIVLGWCQAARAGDRSAFELAKDGNQFIGERSKDKVVRIHSERSVGTLTPSIWYVVYYDDTKETKTVQVKFWEGKKMEVKEPSRWVQQRNDSDDSMDHNRLKVDSNKAIKTATQDSLLEGIKLTATQLWLENGNAGPTWKVRIWATRMRDAHDVEVGDVYISAYDGSVLRRDLHINRAE